MNQSNQHNRLIHEKSPYLLQHAYNPVDWYPWGDEAFAKAKAEDKPIFLSIGYSTCHWCHVMEKESFEDQEVADLLNRDFIAVKVDREERPDVDHLYMTVCQAMTQQGGWPLTIIMSPEQKPFFAGTYLPKENRFGRSGLVTLLGKVKHLWDHDRAKTIQTGERVIEAVGAYLNPVEEGKIERSTIDYAYEQYARTFDETYGGFGEAPKFPRPHDLLFLLRYWHQSKEQEALSMVTHTLDAMRRGGIYDHLGYGFARYSVDREWLVPHFEKMLYDNALLALAYVEAYQITKEKRYAQTADEIFTYVLRDMTAPTGGFYSAEDADSEGKEGTFYVWTPAEIKSILGEEEGVLFCKVYHVTEEGNFEEKTSILHQIMGSLTGLAEEYGLSEDQLEEKLQQSRKQLFEARKKRVHPHKDDKILTAWNGLMIAALAKGARVLQNDTYADAAIRAVQFIDEKLTREDGRLLARYRDGEAKYLGYLDDYAFLTWGLMELYEATFTETYLKQAQALTNQMLNLFGDEQEGGLYFYGVDGEQLFTRPKEIYDGAIPSGNSVAAYNLIRLGKLTSDPQILAEADRQLNAFAQSVAASPISHSFFIMAMQFALEPGKEIVVTGSLTHDLTKDFIQLLRTTYLPNATLAYGEQFLVGEIKRSAEDSAVYICENYACQSPIYDRETLAKAII
ncbi:thioredoxin domain-containing protein [Hazenella sp. IB182357]|uniref:Thioredoxin domain-containing protein n=1 Tax=Polycladospora coralii TaxID=2771432 RepID=A0A926NGQ5_9BACL|nr:thioredoxin domain-containing protein [Polycladospora coralii]MBD1373023.1 thioredoxin domain-containing protein [Polycladospora coralii]